MPVRYVDCFTIICLVITKESACTCALNQTTVGTIIVLGGFITLDGLVFPSDPRTNMRQVAFIFRFPLSN